MKRSFLIVVSALVASLVATSPLFALPALSPDGWGVGVGYYAQDKTLASVRATLLLPENRGQRFDTRFGVLVGGATEAMSAPLDNYSAPEYRIKALLGGRFDAVFVRRSHIEMSAGLALYWMNLETRSVALTANKLPSNTGWIATESAELGVEPGISLTFWPVKSIGLGVNGGFQFGSYQKSAGTEGQPGVFVGMNLVWKL